MALFGVVCPYPTTSGLSAPHPARQRRVQPCNNAQTGSPVEPTHAVYLVSSWCRAISNRSLIRRIHLLLLFWVTLMVGLPQMALCQTGGPDPTAGILSFSTHEGGQYDTIDPASGNITISIPIMSKAGKIPFSLSLVGNYHAFAFTDPISGLRYYIVPNPYIWGGLRPAASGGLSSVLNYWLIGSLCNGYYSQYNISSLVLTDVTGASHPFAGQITYGPCGSSGNGSEVASDGSGYTLSWSQSGSNPPSFSIEDRSGNTIPIGTTSLLGGTPGGQFVDPDNVTMSLSVQTVQNSTASQYTYTDTLGLTAMTGILPEPRAGSSPNGNSDTYTYTDASGNPQTVYVNYTLYQQATNFGCQPVDGIYDSGEGGVYFPTSVALPDGETFGLSYEATPGRAGYITGRLAQLNLPTGGSVKYQYTGGNNNTGIQCTTNSWGNMATLKRTADDGSGHTSTWTYSSSSSDQYNNFTTTETDPIGNTITYHFAGPYQTQQSITDINLGVVSTVTTCYNGTNSSQSACVTPHGAPSSVTQMDVYSSVGSSSPSLIETLYDGYGNAMSIKRWKVGAYPPSGSGDVTTTTTYANVGGVSCGNVGASIYDRPCSITSADSLGNTNQVKYTYNSSGHPTQTKTLVNGSNYLTSSATYNSNGTIASSTDVNNAITHYYYNGAGGCSNLLLTSIVFPVNSLTTSYTWDCNGGKATSVADPNSQSTTYGYKDQSGNPDPLWRLRSTTDPLGNKTWQTFSPGGTLPVTIESTMTFNSGNSSVDKLTTLDGLGRPFLQQTRQTPGSLNFDTTVTAYDLLGRVSSVSMPCTSIASQSCSSATTTTLYDALDRPLQLTYGDGGYVTYNYKPGSNLNNDVLITAGPKPTGDANMKQKQFEYDGLGRLTSVCELTGTSNGGGACAQNAPQTGYWTTYSYDGLGRVTGVSQNAQSSHPQGRGFSYDSLNRLTSESNPESGATYYTYDSDGSCGTYTGDLVKKVDAVGNVSCFQYDAIHRETYASYPSGPYASVTPPKTFIYDSTTFTCANPPNGLYPPGAYVASRLAEAYTGPTNAKITDIGYCYSPRGETSDVFESTPNSGSPPYHTTAYYWANGTLYSLGGVPGLSGWTFGPEGEGRLSSATYGTSTNWVTGTTYYPTYAQTTVSFGSGNTDKDVYSVDNSTGRMNGFQFTVGSTPTTLTGTPGWNQNGTLGSLNITDPFNSLDTQNCSYVYDDLARANSTNCVNGSTNVFNQSYTLDPFGNLSKSGSITFAASYLLPNGTTNNQEQSVASCVPTYDANGNMTKDCSFSSPPTYKWDADGNPVKLRSANLTFDAFDREVEYANGSAITQVLYGPIGKMGLMNGQTPSKTRIPLPGGSTAQMIGTNGVTYILHNDWLGSARLTTSYNSRSMYYDTAYAPYGENYSSTSSSTSDLDFTGEFQDSLNGLYDFLYRENDPVQGRWISPDPSGLAAVELTNPQSWNRYAYANNQPLTATDPLGLNSFSTCYDYDCWSGDYIFFEDDLFAASIQSLAASIIHSNPNYPYYFPILPGENSVNFPSPMPAAVLQAIAAAIKGDWRGVLGAELGLAQQSLWSMVPNPMIMDLNKDWSESETCNHFLSPAFNSSTAGPLQGLSNIGYNFGGNILKHTLGPYDFPSLPQYSGDTFSVFGKKMSTAQFSNYLAGFSAAAYDAKYETGNLAEDAAEDMAILYHPKGPYPFGLPWVYRGENYGQWFGSWGGCR